MFKNLILISFLFTSMISYGQERVTFKPEIKPNKIYTTHLTTTSISEVDFIAEQEILDQIKENGMALPMITESTSEVSLKTKTESKNSKGEIPAMIDYGKMTGTTITNGKSTTTENPYSGIKILGKYNTSNQLIIDTIIGDKLTQQMRDVLATTITSLQQQIEFPKKPMKVGDTFKSETPISLPMEGFGTIQMKINMEYLLKDIKNGKAFFDIKQNVTLDMDHEEMNIVASGQGTGTSEYDIKENYLSKYISDLPMELTMNVNEEMTVTVKVTTRSELLITME